MSAMVAPAAKPGLRLDTYTVKCPALDLPDTRSCRFRTHRAEPAAVCGMIVRGPFGTAHVGEGLTSRGPGDAMTPASGRRRACEAVSLRRHYPDQVPGVAFWPLSLPCVRCCSRATNSAPSPSRRLISTLARQAPAGQGRRSRTGGHSARRPALLKRGMESGTGGPRRGSTASPHLPSGGPCPFPLDLRPGETGPVGRAIRAFTHGQHAPGLVNWC
jgi:hypothetical protein